MEIDNYWVTSNELIVSIFSSDKNFTLYRITPDLKKIYSSKERIISLEVSDGKMLIRSNSSVVKISGNFLESKFIQKKELSSSFDKVKNSFSNTYLGISVKSKVELKEGIFFEGSSLTIPPTIFWRKKGKKEIEYFSLKDNKWKKYKNYDVYIHDFISKRSVPCLLKFNPRFNRTLVMIHGGPEYHYNFSYDYLSHMMFDDSINLVKINYSGSTGYSSIHQKKLLGLGSILDIRDICSVIDHVPPHNEIVIYGDSYGAFLGLYIAAFSKIKVKGFVLTGCFYDINYMKLFSNSRSIIFDYLNNDNAKKLSKKILTESIDKSITFIHGDLDKHCPLYPIRYLVQQTHRYKLKVLQGYGHYEIIPHKKNHKARIIAGEIKRIFDN